MSRTLHILAALLAACTAFGGLDLAGIISVVPQNVATWLTIAPPLVATIGHFILSLGDQLDDGVKNDSFPASVTKPGSSPEN